MPRVHLGIVCSRLSFRSFIVLKMAVNSSTTGHQVIRSELQVVVPKRWKEKDTTTSPERNKIWIEPPSTKIKNTTKKVVSVVYYLSRNGQLEHPHFMEITLSSSSDGLHLTDVMKRLDVLRGKGMATLYSWSSKRSYKNGFVWHDLSENDFIYPTQGQEYVLKGSELLLRLNDGNEPSSNCTTEISSSSTINDHSKEARKTSSIGVGDGTDFPRPVTRRRNQSWSSIDLQEYKVYKIDSTGAIARKAAAADASTQTTNDKIRRQSKVAVKEETESIELNRDEISPPPSESSPETSDSMVKSDGRLILCPEENKGEIVPSERSSNNRTNGRMKASSVLMQLISCGAVSFKDCGAMAVKEPGFSLLSQFKSRLPTTIEHGGEMVRSGKYVDESLMENPSFERLRLEDKEYFSGSLIQTPKDNFLSLKRSSSYNADRSARLELAVKEIEGVRTKCIPRKSKTVVIKREADNGSASGNGGGCN